MPAPARIEVGVIVSTTGPAVSPGAPERNTIALSPSRIAGRTVEYVVLDDASDTTRAVADVRAATRPRPRTEVPQAADPARCRVDFAPATPALHGAGIGLGSAVGRERFVRLAGSGISAAGLVLPEQVRRPHRRPARVVRRADTATRSPARDPPHRASPQNPS